MLPDISSIVRIAGLEPFQSESKINWYISCFSEERDSFLLWRGFTAKFSGFAIDLKYNGTTIIHDSPSKALYSKIDQNKIVKKIVDASMSNLLKRNILFEWMTILGNFLILKCNYFSSENKWHVIWPVINNDPNQKNYTPPGQTRRVLYVELKLDD